MWPLYVIGGVVIAGKLLFGDWAEQHNKLVFERRKRRQERAEEPLLDLTGARAFWKDRIDCVGRFHVKGMPKDATFTAILSELTDDHQLVLDHYAEGRPEMCRVFLWDVDGYLDGDGSSSEDED